MQVNCARDLATIDAWMARYGYVQDERGWVPGLPRWLYFDGQIVRYRGDTVIDPMRTLHHLRWMLMKSHASDAL